MFPVLSRGGYCPKDLRQTELLVQLCREIEVAYCRLITIGTDNLLKTKEYRTGVGAHWPFLSDAASFKRTSILLSTRIRTTIP
jgi:hypothetical protein